jgi:hypothetical protein
MLALDLRQLMPQIRTCDICLFMAVVDPSLLSREKPQTAAWMQVSRTPRLIFQLGTALPGVGEALKWEIAGMVLVGQPGLWGFEDGACFGFGWE